MFMVALYNLIVLYFYLNSGGIEVIFNGTNLDVVQNPVMAVNDSDYVAVFNVS